MKSSEIFVHMVEMAAVWGFPIYATILFGQGRKYLRRRREKAWAVKQNAIQRTLPRGSYWDNQRRKWYIAFRGGYVVMSEDTLDVGLRCLGLDREKELT